MEENVLYVTDGMLEDGMVPMVSALQQLTLCFDLSNSLDHQS